MKRTLVIAMVAASAVVAAGLDAQTVPENSQAARVDIGYRRPPTFRIDPFTNLHVPGWCIQSRSVPARRRLPIYHATSIVLLFPNARSSGAIPMDAMHSAIVRAAPINRALCAFSRKN